jgi:hypothetical protein
VKVGGDDRLGQKWLLLGLRIPPHRFGGMGVQDLNHLRIRFVLRLTDREIRDNRSIK